jgi:hypothetical protein
MEPEDSLSCSQEPYTGPYPKQIDPVHTIPSYISKSPPIYVLVFLVVFFLLAFPPIFYMDYSSPPFVLHALPISSSLVHIHSFINAF